MLPLVEEILRLEEIAEFWSREHDRVRTTIEIYDEMLCAFWQGRLTVYGAGGRIPVDRRKFLQIIRMFSEHPGFGIFESRDAIPPRAKKHADGGVTVDPTTCIALPLNMEACADDALRRACELLSTRSFADYHAAIKPALRVLSTTRDALGIYCDSVGYARPQFWFGNPKRKRESFGGRPTVMRQIKAEMNRRADRQALAPKLREEAKALLHWANANVDERMQIPQLGALENGIREDYKQLKSRHSADVHKT